MVGLRKVLAAIVAAFFVLGLWGVAFAAESEYSVKGKVVSVDFLARKLTVKSIDKIPALISGPLGEYTFSMNEITKVTMCNQEKPLEDIKVGQEITVSYHAGNGQLYADSIAMPAPLVACLLE